METRLKDWDGAKFGKTMENLKQMNKKKDFVFKAVHTENCVAKRLRVM